MYTYAEPQTAYAKYKLDWIEKNAEYHRGRYDDGKIYAPNGMEFPFVILHNYRSGKTICIPVRSLSPEERSIRRLRRKLSSYVREGNRFRAFWSLTYRKIEEFANNGSQLRKLFNRIQMFRKAKGYSPLSYCWKYEEGEKTSRPHFHVLVDGYVKKQLLEKYWSHGFVDMRGIENEKACYRYIFKYFSKEQPNLMYWDKGKRFSSSRNIPKAPPSLWKRLGWSKEPLDLTQKFYNRGPMNHYL